MLLLKIFCIISYNIDNICKRARDALARVAPCTNMQERRINMKYFVTSQFEYFPLI